jgi:hypothetical protein
MKDAKNALQIAMTTLGPVDIGVAYENYGITGMQPLQSQYVGVNDQGKFMYDCTWWDNNEDDGTLIKGRVFVWYDAARNKILADN